MKLTCASHMFPLIIFTLALGCVLSSASAADLPRDIPDYGIMLNEDGDVVFMYGADEDPNRIAEKLTANLASLLEVPVRTLVFNVACGSDIMHYPTEVASRWGWRKTEAETRSPWNDYMPPMRAAAAAGLDSVRIAGDWAKANDLLFVPSYRINDAHYVYQPQDNPLTGRFWAEHGARYELGVSPVPEHDNYKHLLDFAHEPVRAYRLAVIREVVARYADVMDGLQLDMTRHPILFAAGQATTNAPLLTEMMRKVRNTLDEAGREQGRYLPLMVRVPPSIRNCHWAGIEIERWIREGIVDVVMPSAGMTLAHDTPYDTFAAIASPAGAQIAGAIFPRTQFAWPMTPKPTAADYAGVVNRKSSFEQIRGAVNNASTAGISIIEFYNVNLPLDTYGSDAIRAAAQPQKHTRVYAVTPAYYLDHTDTYEYAKQIPATVESNKPKTLTLHVGESFDGSTSAPVMLRLGLRGISDMPMPLRVSINDEPVYDGTLPSASYIKVTGKRSRPSRLHPSDPTGYLHIALPNPEVLKQGINEIRIDLQADNTLALLEIVELQIAVFGQ